MLKAGPYPWALKQRVMSRRGHLSNDAVAEFLAGESFDGKARMLMLAHLSKNNNFLKSPSLSAQRALEGRSSVAQQSNNAYVCRPGPNQSDFSFLDTEGRFSHAGISLH